ncbi:hypothetical protein SAMN05216344_110125 [Polaromonas sp. OV174]|uniref:hypothetical protein n=1 Tax=Polaromonas sp. OV174 TaxID=1855300 RepID=UPI0008E94015|nr:hypothetical protein [Polaromonas sp. OV174]SFC17613.1 hypothetical protein SAMN05216344_110125 [Polaromonas sp. OV174]
MPTSTMKSEIDITARIRVDSFEAIKYEKRPGKKGAVIGMQLGAHFVFRWIFEDAWKHISAGIATADRCKFHAAESLFNNPEVWDGYEAKGIHIAIGRCLAYFVRKEMLPLFCVNPYASNKLYMVHRN